MSASDERREDLLADATALVERAELQMPGEPAAIVAGFRRAGQLSLYFAEEPVYQFNAAGELRRAFVDGSMIVAIRRQLVRLAKTRTAEATRLAHQPLDGKQAADLLAAVQERLATLAAAIEGGRIAVQRQVPVDGQFLPRLQQWLAAHAGAIAVADAANV